MFLNFTLRLTLTYCIMLGFYSSNMKAQTSVWFFRDGSNPGFYDSGLAFKTPPSIIEQGGGSDKIPTVTNPVFQGNNSLKLRWTSKAGGDWSALVIAPGFVFQDISQTDTLSFWVFAPDGLAKANLPTVFMECAPNATKTKKYNLANFTNDLPVAAWTEVKIPLTTFFNDPAQTAVQFTQTKAIIFGQNAADGNEHILYIDNVRTYRGSAANSLATPTNLVATGYDSHIELTWTASTSVSENYQIWRNTEGGTFALLKTADNSNGFIDFVGNTPTVQSFKYKIKAVSSSLNAESNFSSETTAATKAMTDDELLTMVQRYTFRYFWEFAHPASGMARERNTSGNVVTTGGTGFGIMGIVTGVERNFVSRTEGVNQLLKMVGFLETADKFKGVFPHWLDGSTGKVVPFSTFDNGGDLVETAFLMQGLLTARQYFNKTDANEALLRQKITQLWEAVDFNWQRKNGSDVLYWHWSPNYDWRMNFPIRGYNEALIIYLLGVASPTKNVPARLYTQGWANSNTYLNGNTFLGYTLPVGPAAGGPLFFAHYSFLGFDPRNKKDNYCNYFNQNKQQSLINWAYCKANPRGFAGYSENCWGLTASDDPSGYSAHAPYESTDNGTIAPTAALSSMPYTPPQSMAALKHFYRVLGAKTWGKLGFIDAFNVSKNWYADTYLAIDQGPIIAMIENHRTGLLWKYFMQNPEIKTALDAIGFVPDSTATALGDPLSILTDSDLKIYPNPSVGTAFIDFNLNKTKTLDLDMVDATGRTVKTMFNNRLFTAGKNQVNISVEGIAKGFYTLILRGGDFVLKGKILMGK